MQDSDKFRIIIASQILSNQLQGRVLTDDDPAVERVCRLALILADHLIRLGTANKNEEHA